MSATKELVKPYNLISGATGQIFHLIWWEALKAAKSAYGCLKGNKSMHLLCNYHTHACFPWQAVMALNPQNRSS